ncbi:hypothetical protein C8J57DRAFT_1557564 [Mycena rebaudengoi]|nr:hypothetical protein C8J57DRAFT_1557564 [Mycena rebaudengoi]
MTLKELLYSYPSLTWKYFSGFSGCHQPCKVTNVTTSSGTTMSLFGTSPNYLTAALDIDIPSAADMARRHGRYNPGSHGAVRGVDARRRWRGWTTHRLAFSADQAFPCAIPGRWHTTDSAHGLRDTFSMAYFDPWISAGTPPTGDDASLALLATIGAFGMPPDISRTSLILTTDVLALSRLPGLPFG